MSVLLSDLLRDPVTQAAGMVLLASLFGPAAWHKITRRQDFAGSLQAYRLVPPRLLPALAFLLPLLEALVPLGLIAPSTRMPALLLAAALLLVYALAMALNLLRGRASIDCGCGDEAQPLSWALVLRNAVLVALALAWSAPALARAPEGFDLWAALLCSLGFIGLHRVSEELMRQSGRLRRLKEMT